MAGTGSGFEACYCCCGGGGGGLWAMAGTVCWWWCLERAAGEEGVGEELVQGPGKWVPSQTQDSCCPGTHLKWKIYPVTFSSLAICLTFVLSLKLFSSFYHPG